MEFTINKTTFNKSCIKDKLLITGITLLGIILRILWILIVPSVPVSDFKAYTDIAVDITNNQHNTLLGFQSPGYPIFLSIVYKILGINTFFIGKVANIILSTLTLIIIYKILTKLFNNKSYVYIGYLIINLLPNYIAYNNIIGSEILATFLFSIVIFIQIHEFNIKTKTILLGISVPMLALTKSALIIYPVIAFFIEWLNKKRLKESLNMCIGITIISTLIISPWAYRNHKIFNQFIPTSYNSGYVLFLNNNNDNNKGLWMPLSSISMSENLKQNISNAGFTYEQAINITDPKLNNIYKKEAKRWIINNPLKFIELGVKRVIVTFFGGAIDIYLWAMPSGDSKKFICNILQSTPCKLFFYAFMYILSTSGIIYTFKNIKSILKSLLQKELLVDYSITIPVINICLFTLICFVFEGQPRYNFPITFIFVICFIRLLEEHWSKEKA